MPWSDNKAIGDDKEVNISFRPDRSIPERCLGQVMGEFYKYFTAKFKHDIPDRAANIRLGTSKPKGILFAAEGEDISNLVLIKFHHDRNFTVEIDPLGLANFGYGEKDAQQAVEAVRRSVASFSITI